jgi:Co/Zn/Cd efflux system component
VCADTLRSVAVFVAAGIAYLWNAVTPDAAYADVSLLADAYASLMVSIIIIVSLGPLLQGLYYTALEIKDMTIKGHQLPAEVTLNV